MEFGRKESHEDIEGAVSRRYRKSMEVGHNASGVLQLLMPGPSLANAVSGRYDGLTDQEAPGARRPEHARSDPFADLGRCRQT